MLQSIAAHQDLDSKVPMTSQDSLAHMRSMSTGECGPCEARFSIKRSATSLHLGNKTLQTFHVVYEHIKNNILAMQAFHMRLCC